MTGARAIAQFACSVANVRVLRLFVRPRLVVVGVTSCTVRLKCRELPIDHVGITLMAVNAVEVAAMIERFVGQSGVTVVCGCPRIRDMAQPTILYRVEVTGVHAGGRGAIVAGRAGAYDLVVIDSCYRRPDSWTVAVLANICCLRM